MKNICYIFILTIVLFGSCKRDADELEHLGPYIEPLEITQPLAINANPVSFGGFGGPVFFNAEFNKANNWILTITGITSGAVKKISGSSKALTYLNNSWDGSSDNLYFFRSEICVAVLSFPGNSITQTIKIIISTPKSHQGYLINDFEAPAFGSHLGSYIGNYFDGPDQATSIIDLFTISPALQGNKVLRFDCNDVNSSYYTGGVYHNSAASSYGIPALNNDSLYLNLFIYGYPAGNAALSIEVKENDGDIWAPAQILVNWTDWKLVSLKYSEMINNKSTGNITKETNKINAVNISMNSIPAGTNSKALVDYLQFTVGKPIVP